MNFNFSIFLKSFELIITNLCLIFTIYYFLKKVTRISSPLFLFLSTVITFFGILQIYIFIFGQLHCLGNWLIFPPLIFSLGWIFFVLYRNRKKGQNISADFKNKNVICSSWDSHLILFFTAAYCITMFSRALNMPPLHYDALYYHLYIPAIWLKCNQIGAIQFPSQVIPVQYLSHLHHVFNLWLLLFFGNDFIASVSQFFPFLVSGIAVYGVCREFNVSKGTSLIVSCIFLIKADKVQYALEPNVDYSVGLFIVSATFFFYSQTGKLSQRHFFAGLAVGAALSTKNTCLYFLPALSIPLLFIIVYNIWENKSINNEVIMFNIFTFIFSNLCYVLGGFFLTGSLWYVLNFIETGNPFFPIQVKIGSLLIFPGAYDLGTMLPFYTKFTLSKPVNISLMFVHEIGYSFLILLPMGYLISIIRKSFEEKVKSVSFLILHLLMVISLLYLDKIGLGQERFWSPVFILSCLPIGVALDKIINCSIFLFQSIYNHINYSLLKEQNNEKLLHRIEEFIRFSIFIFFFYSAFNKIPGNYYKLIAAMALISFMLGILIFKIIDTHFVKTKFRKIEYFIVGSFLILISAYWIQLHYLKFTSSRYQVWENYKHFQWQVNAWEWAEKWLPEDCRIAVAGTDLLYPLMGRDLSKLAIYVNTSGEADWKYHDFIKSYRKTKKIVFTSDRGLYLYHDNANFESWWENCKKLKINYLLICKFNDIYNRSYASTETGFPKELDWVNENKEFFELLWYSDHIRIYKIIEKEIS